MLWDKTTNSSVRGGGAAPTVGKKSSIIRAKLMYRSGGKKYFIIQYLDLFVFIPHLA